MSIKKQVKTSTSIATLNLCAVCGDNLSGGLDTFTQVSIVDGAQQFDIMCSDHFWAGWEYCTGCDDFVPMNSNGDCSLCSWVAVPAQGSQLVLGVG